MKEYLIKGIEKIGLEYDEKRVSELLKYLDMLVEYNSHTNLTAVREKDEIIDKHFLDSLLVQKYITKNMKKAIDIGTGAGFPGMVLAIYNKDIKFTLMDSIGKKTKFLELVKEELGLTNVEVVNCRAEEFADDETKESYDLGLCRGVSKLSTILEYIIPFLKVEGKFLCQKMVGTGEEEEANHALEVLNSEIICEYKEYLPYSEEERLIIDIKKIGKNDKKYPRRVGIPLKRPL